MDNPIGGAFPYKEGPLTLPFTGGNYLLLTNARSALYVLHQLLRPVTTWLPSYICPSLLNPEYNIRFYEGQPESQPGDMVLVVDYFGWPYREFPCAGTLVEDGAQAFFTPKRADYVIYSPAKCLGSPDGGILWSRHSLAGIPLQPPPQGWLDLAREGRRRERPDWFAMGQAAKKLSPTGPFRMHYQNCLHYDARWPLQYVKNYTFLQDRLPDLSLLGPVHEGVVPSGFPIRTERRDELRKWLINNTIYPPVHWDIRGVPDEFGASHRLSQTVMTLPCDYRYDENDMGRIVTCVVDFFRRS